MSEHSAHLISLPFGFRTWLWRYTCLLLLILMLWHRQAIFESKGDEVAFLCRMHSNLEVSRHLFASRLNTHSQIDWAIEDQAKNLNATVRWWVSIQPTWLHCRLAFAPDFDDILVFTDTHTHTHHTPHHTNTTHTHHTHTMLRHRQAIFCFHTHTMLRHRQAIFESKGTHLSLSTAGSDPMVFGTKSPTDWMPSAKPFELLRIKQKLKLNSLSLWSASIHLTRPHRRLAFAPCSGNIHVCYC